MAQANCIQQAMVHFARKVSPNLIYPQIANDCFNLYSFLVFERNYENLTTHPLMSRVRSCLVSRLADYIM